MFEVYVLVAKKKPVFLSIFAIFSFIMGGISLLALMLGLFIFMPTAIIGLLLGYFLHTRNYEFEYSFFDDEIRFAKIINKSKRKKIKGYKMAEVVAIAPMNDPSVHQHENNKAAQVRRLTSGQQDAKVYVIVANSVDGMELTYFEPDDRFLDAVCTRFGYKVRR